MTPADCPFFRIVSRELDSSVVHESTTVLAFMDIDPVTARPRPRRAEGPPARPWRTWTTTSPPEMFAVARAVAGALRRSPLPSEGVNLFYADGEAAFQEVFHSHLHVFPRYAGDGFRISARWGSNPARGELDSQAEAIRAAL